MTSISVQQPTTPVPVQRRTFLGIPIPGTNKNTPQQIPATPQPAHGYSLDKIHSEQVNAIENKLLAERDQLTIDVLQDCFNYSTDKIAEVNNILGSLFLDCGILSKEWMHKQYLGIF